MPGCGDCFYKTPLVGSKGPEDSPFIIVGESPGIQEVSKGEPFVGPSGTVIHDTLTKVGGGDLPTYFTNAIHCFPRQKDADNIRLASQRCNKRLIEEVSKHPRKVILALGASALQSLTGNWDLKITKERGKIFQSPLAEIGIVAAVHPAFLLRGSGNWLQFERDVRYAVELMLHGNNARRLPSGTSYEILQSSRDVKHFVGDVLDTLPQDSPLGCDIETTGFNFQTDKILCVGIQYEAAKSAIINNWDYETRTTKGLITDNLFDRPLDYIWHNGKFDCRFLRYNRCTSAKVVNDTMLQSYALNERRGIHDLDQAASDWLGSVNHKHLVDYIYKTKVFDPQLGRERKGNLSDLPQELLWKYLALDINDTFHLDASLRLQVLGDVNLRKFYTRHLIPGSEYLLKVETNGMLRDPEWVMSNFHRLKAECDKHEATLNEIAIEQGMQGINPRSWQQVTTLLYNKLKLGSPSLSTDDDTLLGLPKHPAITALQAYRKAQKAKGTYVHPLMIGDERKLIVDAKGKQTKKEAMLYPDERVHPSYLLHGTPTSRLACRDLNMQNIPRDPHLRGQFIARPGYVICEWDYSQAELRSLAALSKCAALGDIFISGRDLHVEFSKYLFGEHFTKEEKMAAKTVNFGIPYGREAPSIASDPQLNAKMHVTMELAQSWIDGWATRFPGAWAFIEECAMAPVRNQTIITCFGNKKRPGVVSREKLRDLQNESRNFPHQSIASNLTIRAGIELVDTLQENYHSYICNTVHDCIVAEVPANWDLIQEVTKIVRSKMEEIPQRFAALRAIPFKTSAEMGHHWGNLIDLNDFESKYGADFDKIPHYIEPH